MRTGVRGHDITADTPRALCEKLDTLGVHEIQLVAHKSFPGFAYSEETIRDLAASFQRHGVYVAVYGCYIDPLSDEGQARFHEHIRYAQILNAGCIATETALGITNQAFSWAAHMPRTTKRASRRVFPFSGTFPSTRRRITSAARSRRAGCIRCAHRKRRHD